MLSEKTGNADLAPLHRIDKDTSGLTIFSKRQGTRSHFARLFRPENAPKHLVREYHAICELPMVGEEPFHRLEDHIARCPDHYYHQIVLPNEPPNAVCHVVRIEEFEDPRYGSPRGLFRVRIETGKKHQIRVQLSNAGFPIVDDRIYGSVPFYDPESIENPMKLRCHRIAIMDYPTADGSGLINREWVSEREFEG